MNNTFFNSLMPIKIIKQFGRSWHFQNKTNVLLCHLYKNVYGKRIFFSNNTVPNVPLMKKKVKVLKYNQHMTILNNNYLQITSVDLQIILRAGKIQYQSILWKIIKYLNEINMFLLSSTSNNFRLV